MSSVSDIEDLAFDLEDMKFDSEKDRLRSAKIILTSQAVKNGKAEAWNKGWEQRFIWETLYENWRNAIQRMGLAAANVQLPPPDKPVNPYED